MKKILLLLFVLFTLQITEAQNTTYGVKGGVNYASFIGNKNLPFDYDYKLGYQLGGFVKIQLVGDLFLQPELLYSLQGVQSDVRFNDVILPQNGIDDLFSGRSITVKRNESTLILPVLLKYYVSEKFNIEIGPQVDYLFSSKLKADGENRFTEKPNDFNFGFDVGVGYDFNEVMGIVARYNYGLSRSKSDLFGKLRNSVFQLSFEYRFN